MGFTESTDPKSMLREQLERTVVGLRELAEELGELLVAAVVDAGGTIRIRDSTLKAMKEGVEYDVDASDRLRDGGLLITAEMVGSQRQPVAPSAIANDPAPPSGAPDMSSAELEALRDRASAAAADPKQRFVASAAVIVRLVDGHIAAFRQTVNAFVGEVEWGDVARDLAERLQNARGALVRIARDESVDGAAGLAIARGLSPKRATCSYGSSRC